MDVLTTKGIPERERFAYWADVACKSFLPLDCRRLSERDFFGEISTIRTEDLNFSYISSLDHRIELPNCRRDARADELIMVQVQLSGRCVVRQDDRTVTLDPGDLVIYDGVRPYTLDFPDHFDALVLHTPRWNLLGRAESSEALTARAVRSNSVMGELAAPFLRRVGRAVAEADSATVRRLTQISLRLIDATIGTLHLGNTNGEQSWARAALLGRAKAAIEERLAQSELNSSAIAKSLRISVRYLQDLFHDEGTTVSHYIWARRLQKCRRELADPLLRQKLISEIAFDGGFSNVGHFSRRFKAAFESSPGDYRRAIQLHRGKQAG